MSANTLLGLSWNLRTVLRLGLVIAGMAFFTRGIMTGLTFDLVLGALAMLVGAVGLYFERRDNRS